MASVLVIQNGVVLTPTQTIPNGAVVVREGRIEAVGRSDALNLPPEAQIVDAEGGWIVPGFIDVHTHGGAGFDFMSQNRDEIETILRWLPSTGVTGVLATLASASLEETLESIRLIRRVMADPPQNSARILGIHLEGPYLNPLRRGAQPERPIRLPNLDEMKILFREAAGCIRLVTLAPELPGALDLIRFLRAKRVRVGAGHSDATAEQEELAYEAGLNQVTHLFNGMASFNHRQPGLAGAALAEKRLYAQLILDGIHVHPTAAKTVIQVKGFHHTLLVSDATQATGQGDGVYIRPGNRKIIVSQGVARLESGSLAGSVLTLDQAVRNGVQQLGLPLAGVVRMASYTPACSLGYQNRIGRLSAGKEADLTIFNAELQVKNTLVCGKIVFSG